MKTPFLTQEEVLQQFSVEDIKNGATFEKNEFPKFATIEFDEWSNDFTVFIAYGKRFKEEVNHIDTIEEAIEEINEFLAV